MLVQPLRMATECEVDLVRRRPGCAIGLRPWIPDKPLETYHPETTHLTPPCSCEACSAFTRVAPARSADPLRGLSIEVLQIIRRLLIRSDRFRLEREFAGPDSHRGERCALPRHTEQSS